MASHKPPNTHLRDRAGRDELLEHHHAPVRDDVHVDAAGQGGDQGGQHGGGGQVGGLDVDVARGGAEGV